MFSRRLLPLALALLACHGVAEAEPPPPSTYTALLSLVRYDLPLSRSDGFAPTRQLAQRQGGQDAVEWPDLTLNGAPLFRQRAEEKIPLALAGATGESPFQMKADARIEPGNHWFRALEGRDRRHCLYTADGAARTASPNETMTGRYELWTFPVKITAEGAPVKIVALKAGGQTVFRQDGPWRSLTLLLPASAPGVPYELSVDGRPAVQFQTGPMPSKPGTPRARLHPVDLTLPGDGPRMRVQSLVRPEVFPAQAEWQADLAELSKYAAVPLRVERRPGLQRYLGLEVPRSPMTIYALQLPQGLSGGFYRQTPGGFSGTAQEYGASLAEQGFDAVFDQANTLPEAEDPQSCETRAAALAQAGVKLGLQYDGNASLPALGHPQVALFSHTLPEWHAPLYRSLSLAAQRLGRLPNFLGFDIGAGSANYARGERGERPSPANPWGEAMVALLGQPQPVIPRAPGAGLPEQPYEYTAKTTAEFLRYVQRFDSSFQQYGYFAEAVRQASPRLFLTTASFGSAPGAGARGGWPWASTPGRALAEGLGVQQAYDLNRTHAAKPLHNVALTDRLRSYWPKTTTWSLLDNHLLLYGREAYQRACALALTRGIQGLGTNFLASRNGPGARPEVAAFEGEMHGLVHRFGGVFAHTEPLATIGIFYGQHEAVQRGVLTGETPPAAQLYDGSHEGKVTEALFLCHAAGWPARVITYQEIKRGELPAEMQAILLVGLKAEDASWSSGGGLEAALQTFLARGGRLLADEDSSWPATLTKTGLRVAAYQPQAQVDATPLLFARNRENIEKLRTAMAGVAPPLAASSEPRLWAIPTQCGDTQYVTALNQSFAEGAEATEFLQPSSGQDGRPELWKTKGNASRYVPPQQGMLTWQTRRPIYDLRAGRKLTPEEAAQVDLTKDAFAWYALPPAEPTSPQLLIRKCPDGFYEADVTVAQSTPMRGVPIQITVRQKGESVAIYGATGFAIPLPFSDAEPATGYQLEATELLSGLSTAQDFTTTQRAPLPAAAVRLAEPTTLAKFAGRADVPLVVGLTAEQEKEPALVAQADALVRYYRAHGRPAKRGLAAPGGVVEGLQPAWSPHRFPQWKTAATDLVLFGTPATNVLMLDQLRAGVWPLNHRNPKPGEADVLYTRSAFVGEMDVINIVAPDVAGLTAAVRRLTP